MSQIYVNSCSTAILQHFKCIVLYTLQIIPLYEIFTTRVRSTTGGYVFTLCVCSQGWGYPWSLVPDSWSLSMGEGVPLVRPACSRGGGGGEGVPLDIRYVASCGHAARLSCVESKWQSNLRN